MIGVHPNTIRRWVDAYLAGGKVGDIGVLKGWRTRQRFGRGLRRMVDEEDAHRVAWAERNWSPE